MKRSFVVRQGKCLPVNFEKLLINGDLSQNIYLEPDDFIYFPSAAARDVYVLGAVTVASAPVRDSRGVVIAAISVSGPIDRIGRRPGARR